MKQVEVLSQKNRDWLESLLDALPEHDPDMHCQCGECDGSGHIVEPDEEGIPRAKICPNKFKSDKIKSLNERFQDWENWETIKIYNLQSYMERKEFVHTSIFNSCKSYLDEILKGKEIKPLILLGSHGRSKSIAPLFLLKELTQAGYTVHAMKWFQFIDAHRKGIDGYKFINTQLKMIRDSHFIFVDEYGRSGTEIHDHNAMRKILDLTHRRKWMVISSNLNVKEFLESLDSYAQDRLKPKIAKFVSDKSEESLRF
jgi:DNA replication protein DnaC